MVTYWAGITIRIKYDVTRALSLSLFILDLDLFKGQRGLLNVQGCLVKYFGLLNHYIVSNYF